MNRPTKHSIIIFISFLFFGCSENTTNAPNSIGNIQIGMNKTEYLSEIGLVSPIDCKTLKDKNGELVQFDLRSLNTLSTLFLSPCLFYFMESTTKDAIKSQQNGIDDTIHIDGITYNYIYANKKASKAIEPIGEDITAIFLKNKLIGIEIRDPKVTSDTLKIKYGNPKINDRRQTEICQNRAGSKFEHKIGFLDAVWSNGKISATYRINLIRPRKTCTDNENFITYLIEESKQMESIRSAINTYKEDAKRIETKSSPF